MWLINAVLKEHPASNREDDKSTTTWIEIVQILKFWKLVCLLGWQQQILVYKNNVHPTGNKL